MGTQFGLGALGIHTLHMWWMLLMISVLFCLDTLGVHMLQWTDIPIQVVPMTWMGGVAPWSLPTNPIPWHLWMCCTIRGSTMYVYLFVLYIRHRKREVLWTFLGQRWGPFFIIGFSGFHFTVLVYSHIWVLAPRPFASWHDVGELYLLLNLVARFISELQVSNWKPWCIYRVLPYSMTHM